MVATFPLFDIYIHLRGVGSLSCFPGLTDCGNLPLAKWDTADETFTDQHGYSAMQSLNNGVGSQQISGLTGSGNLPLIQCKQDGLRRLNVGVGSHIYFTGLTGSGNLPADEMGSMVAFITSNVFKH